MVLGCEILFDQNAHGVYFAGQMLSGRVNIALDKPKKLKGMSLFISGNAICKWSEHEVRRTGGLLTRLQAVEYKGREDYLSTTTYLLPFSVNGVRIQIAGQARTRWNERVHRFVDGRPEKKELFYQADETFLDSKAYLRKGADDGSATGALVELPAGNHTYTFACSLPPMLPTSFEGQFGHIRYTVKVVLERPWKFDQTYKVAFTVLNELDLNTMSPILRIPTQMEVSTSFWCGPCTSGQLSIVASIPQSGYVPGQNIAISAVVTNLSHIPVDYMRFSLRKVVLYKSHIPSSKTKLELDVVQERRTGSVRKKDQRSFEVHIAIPPIPPTNLNLCKVIEIAYEVKVEAKVSGPHNSPFVLIPVTIGTVPLNRNTPDPKTPSIVTAPALPICEQPSPTQPQPTGSELLAAPPLYTPQSSNVGGDGSWRPEQAATSGTAPTAVAVVQPILAPIANGERLQQLQNIPPPSYEESLRGNHIIEDEDDESHPISQQPYTPRYVVYRFDELPPPSRPTESNPLTHPITHESAAIAVSAFTMTLPEARRAAFLQQSMTAVITETNPAIIQQSSTSEVSTQHATGPDSDVVVAVDQSRTVDARSAAENDRHAAKLRENMESWT